MSKHLFVVPAAPKPVPVTPHPFVQQVGRQGPEQDREDAPETQVDLYTKLPVPPLD